MQLSNFKWFLFNLINCPFKNTSLLKSFYFHFICQVFHFHFLLNSTFSFISSLNNQLKLKIFNIQWINEDRKWCQRTSLSRTANPFYSKFNGQRHSVSTTHTFPSNRMKWKFSMIQFVFNVLHTLLTLFVFREKFSTFYSRALSMCIVHCTCTASNWRTAFTAKSLFSDLPFCNGENSKYICQKPPLPSAVAAAWITTVANYHYKTNINKPKRGYHGDKNSRKETATK